MAAKEVLFSASARKRIASGIDTLANAVKVTLGPRGRNVILERSWTSPLVTKAGVTVAKEIDVKDKFANMGVQMVKEVAEKTAAIAGDGTTTATVLAQSIYREGARLVAAGHHPIEIKRGIDAAVEQIVAALQTLSKPCKTTKEITQVGTVSANGDKAIGEMLATAMDKVGRQGVISIEDGRTVDNELNVVEGMQWDRGYLSPYFITDAERQVCELDDPLILIHEKKLTNLKEMIPVLELAAQQNRPLLIIAEDLEGEALAALVVNKMRGALNVCAVKPPGFGDRRKEMLKDIAAMTNANPVMEEVGIRVDGVTIKDLGRAKRIVLEKETCTIIDGAGKKADIEGRIALCKKELDETNSDYDKEKLQERLAKLAGGVAVIKVGAASEAEQKEKRARVDDALHATRAAVEEGIVPGGGVALIRVQSSLFKLKFDDDRQYGVDIVRRAIEEPLRQIASNVGIDASVVVERVREGKGAFGFNAASEIYEDLVAAGVIDPAKVVRVALQNAASVAGLLLTSEAMIAEIPVAPVAAPAEAPQGADAGQMHHEMD